MSGDATAKDRVKGKKRSERIKYHLDLTGDQRLRLALFYATTIFRVVKARTSGITTNEPGCFTLFNFHPTAYFIADYGARFLWGQSLRNICGPSPYTGIV